MVNALCLEAILDMLRVSSFNCIGGKSPISSEDPNAISSSLRLDEIKKFARHEPFLELKGRILRCSIFGNFSTKFSTSSEE